MSEAGDERSVAARRRPASGMVFLVRAYVFIALFAGAAHYARELNTGLLLALAMILAVPAALALWNQAVVRSLLALHQFQPGRVLHWVGSRLVIRKMVGAMLALLITLSSIIHASFFGLREWALVALIPIVFTIGRAWGEGRLWSQFTADVYASRATLRLASWTVALVFVLGWVGLAVAIPEANDGGLIERVETLQAPWKNTPSALARYVGDAFAWATAAQGSFSEPSEEPWWRILIGVVVAPLATVLFVALAMHGLALPAAEVRRVFLPILTGADESTPIPPMSAAVQAAVMVICLLLIAQAAAQLEHVLKAGSSPFAVHRLPECEAIDGKVYKLGTLDAITRVIDESKDKAGRAQASACAALDAAQLAAEKPIDAYLNWYFSLPAEWMRIAKMLTGGLETMLAERLDSGFKSAPELVETLKRAQDDSQLQIAALDALQEKARGVLQDNVLLIDEKACKVVRQDVVAQTLAANEDNALRLRTAGSAGAGLAAGVVAGKVAAKAMTKGSMKLASQVLTKFVLKKAATVSASAAAGAVAGSVIPGLGTAVGAFLGAITGVAISIGVDWAILAVEEGLTRDAMKAELLQAFGETLALERAALRCAP